MVIGLFKNGKVRHERVNRLIALSWIPIPEELQDYDIKKLDVCHKDDDRSNNNISNLIWQTRQQNLNTDSFRDKQRVKHFTKIRCIETGEIFPN